MSFYLFVFFVSVYDWCTIPLDIQRDFDVTLC